MARLLFPRNHHGDPSCGGRPGCCTDHEHREERQFVWNEYLLMRRHQTWLHFCWLLQTVPVSEDKVNKVLRKKIKQKTLYLPSSGYIGCNLRPKKKNLIRLFWNINLILSNSLPQSSVIFDTNYLQSPLSHVSDKDVVHRCSAVPAS